MKLDYSADIKLENSSVKITPLKWKHFELLLPVAIANPNLLKYSPSRFGTETALHTYFQDALQKKEQNLRSPFAIYDKQRNSYAGSTSYMHISATDRRLEIGSTWIGKQFQRTGLNRHCKFLLLQYVFKVLQWERVAFRTDSRNKQSIKAIESIGAIYEGKLRSHMLMPDGYRRNTVCYSILKKEWPGIKETVFGKFKNNA